MSDNRDYVKAGSTLCNEQGEITHWLATDYTVWDIHEEWYYLFENGEKKLHEVWISVRLTTPEELTDEDFILAQFGDVEMTGTDTTQVYDYVGVATPGAHRYWTTEP